MKYNAKSIGIVLCYILAIYGLIILIRKILNREEKNKSKTWSYYVEPYRRIMVTGTDDLGPYTYDDSYRPEINYIPDSYSESDIEPYRYAGETCEICKKGLFGGKSCSTKKCYCGIDTENIAKGSWVDQGIDQQVKSCGKFTEDCKAWFAKQGVKIDSTNINRCYNPSTAQNWM